MRKLLLGLLVLLCLPLQSLAQESIGFSDPDNIQPLLDYRLPEWGYTNFYLDFSTDGNVYRTQVDGADHISSDDKISTRLSPVYQRFYQSEDRQSSYYLRTTLDYYFDRSNDTNNEGTSNQNYNFEIDLALQEKFYLDDSDVFFSSGLNGNFDQVKTDDFNNQTNSNFGQSEFTRNLETNLSIGIGYGRIRNVNPSIRSLRMGERLNAMNSDQVMDSQDYISAAEHLTKFRAYNSIYDRPEKYFWGDMDTQISPDLAALNPFDLLYLTDTTKETIGSRMEGWEIESSIAFDWTTRYSRDDSYENGSIATRHNLLIPQISGRWSKNLSLKHQLGLAANFTSFIRLKPDDGNTTFATLDASWLYNISDRILSTTSTFFYYRFSGSSGFFNVSSEIDYFVENRFSLFSEVLMVHRPKFLDSDHNRRDIQLFFSAGLRYYFKRELF